MSSYFLVKAQATEDAVTGMMVDLLRAFPQETVRALLEEAEAHPVGEWSPPDFEAIVVEPWPTDWPCGEPDFCITWIRGGVPVWYLVVEAKIGAPKSSVDEPEAAPELPTRDQLAKYQRHATELYAPTPVSVLYLTHHGLRPSGDLDDSLRKMSPSGDALPRLLWVSYRDVEDRLRTAADRHEHPAFAVYARGLADVLRALGFFRFRGTWYAELSRLPPLPSCLWWQATPVSTVRTTYRWFHNANRPPQPPVRRPKPYRWQKSGTLPPRQPFTYAGRQ